MVKSFSPQERDQVLRESLSHIRGRRSSPFASADDGLSCPSAPSMAAAAPIEEVHGPQGQVAAASPWSAARLRERDELERDELERAERERAVETERRQNASRQGASFARESAALRDEVAALRDATASLGASANAAVSALIERVERQDAELTALRHRVEGIERRKTATTSRKRTTTTLPSFLSPSRTLAS
jgi:hypothetical protein